MTYLLDTHIFLWSIFNPEKLSSRVNSILNDTDNEILVSSINFWEISIKFAKGNLNLDGYLPDALIKVTEDMGFVLKNLSSEETSSLHNLSGEYHKDPFDRIIIWQAIHNNYTLISDDKYVNMYKTNGLKVVS